MKLEPRIGIELGQEWEDGKMSLLVWVRSILLSSSMLLHLASHAEQEALSFPCRGAGMECAHMHASLQAGAAGEMSEEDLATYLEPLKHLPNVNQVRPHLFSSCIKHDEKQLILVRAIWC